jgi:hypothetical protein
MPLLGSTEAPQRPALDFSMTTGLQSESRWRGAGDGERSAMRRCMGGVFNPEGWQRVAGGRSGAETPGRQSQGSVHPEGMPEFCDPSGVVWRFLNQPTALDPRLLSGKPLARARGPKPNPWRHWAPRSRPVFISHPLAPRQ